MYGSFDIYQCFAVRFRVSELTVCSMDYYLCQGYLVDSSKMSQDFSRL